MLGLDFEGLRYQSSLNWVMRVFSTQMTVNVLAN